MSLHGACVSTCYGPGESTLTAGERIVHGGSNERPHVACRVLNTDGGEHLLGLTQDGHEVVRGVR